MAIDTSIGAAIAIVGTIEALSPSDANKLPEIGVLVIAAVGIAIRRRGLWLGFAPSAQMTHREAAHGATLPLRRVDLFVGVLRTAAPR